jgi:hypothetical protein
MPRLPSASRATLAAATLALLCSPVVRAATSATLLQQWRAESGAGAAPFSASRGQQLFETRGADWSCATCHTRDPRAAGRHATTARPIAPLAPAANPARFTDEAKVAKWMRRNCRDVFGRECTPIEKGDLLTWLLSLE